MAINRRKVLEAARKHLSRGQFDKAIAQYEKLVKSDRRDVRSLHKIGEIQLRKGERDQAVETYRKVVELYAEQGFFLKALAVCKQALKVDPSRLDLVVRLGDMYEQLQLIGDAMSTYSEVANSYMQSGETDRALGMLAKMADLDPDHIPVRIKYAEALSRAGRTQLAADEFEKGATLLKEQGRLDDYVKVAERLLYHRHNDVNVARELAEAYVARNDAKRALTKLQICFKADPRDTRTLELLAEAFRQLNQIDKSISVYREVARVHREAGRLPERAAALERILSINPGDDQASKSLASTMAAMPKDLAVSEPAASVVPESLSAPPAFPSQSPESEAATPFDTEDESDPEIDDDSIIPIVGSVAPQGASAVPMAFEPTAVDDRSRLPLPTSLSYGALAPMTFAQFEALPLNANAPDPSIAASLPAPSALESVLEQADYFLTAGRLREAQGMIADLQTALAAHPLVIDKARELHVAVALASNGEASPHGDMAMQSEFSEDTQVNVRAELLEGPHSSIVELDPFLDKPTNIPQDPTFAVAEKLANDFVAVAPAPEGEMVDVDAIFEQFKKGVAEQVEDEDSATHFDLGIAYKEMGLFEDSRREFKMAMSNPLKECSCWTMIGLSFVEEARFNEAVEAFHSGLSAPNRTDSDELGLHFELGRVYHKAGDNEMSREHFELVQERDAKFRNVKQRLEALDNTGEEVTGRLSTFEELFGKD